MLTAEIPHESSAVSHEEKVKARKLVNRAIAAGRMDRQPCEECGATPAQAHHDDYRQPLAVRWLCPKHHAAIDQQKHPLTKLCEWCGREYRPHPTKRARSKTCSEHCRRRLTAKRLTRYPKVKRCSVCREVYAPPLKGRKRRVTCGAAACVTTARLRAMGKGTADA